MNKKYDDSVTRYCRWMDKQIEKNFPLSEKQWEKVAKTLEEIVNKFPKDVQPDVIIRLHEVYAKWDLKELQMMELKKEKSKSA